MSECSPACSLLDVVIVVAVVVVVVAVVAILRFEPKKNLKCCCFVLLFYSQLSGMSYKYFKYNAQAFFISLTTHFFIMCFFFLHFVFFSALFFPFLSFPFRSTVIVLWFNGIPLCQYGKCVFIVHCTVNFISLSICWRNKSTDYLYNKYFITLWICPNCILREWKTQQKWRKSNKHCVKIEQIHFSANAHTHKRTSM